MGIETFIELWKIAEREFSKKHLTMPVPGAAGGSSDVRGAEAASGIGDTSSMRSSRAPTVAVTWPSHFIMLVLTGWTCWSISSITSDPMVMILIRRMRCPPGTEYRST